MDRQVSLRREPAEFLDDRQWQADTLDGDWLRSFFFLGFGSYMKCEVMSVGDFLEFVCDPD